MTEMTPPEVAMAWWKAVANGDRHKVTELSHPKTRHAFLSKVDGPHDGFELYLEAGYAARPEWLFEKGDACVSLHAPDTDDDRLEELFEDLGTVVTLALRRHKRRWRVLKLHIPRRD